MSTNGNGAAAGGLLKIGQGVMTTLLTAAIIYIFTIIQSINNGMIAMQEWRRQVESNTALPRTEWALEKQFIYAEIAQIRTRVEAQDLRRRDDP